MATRRIAIEYIQWLQKERAKINLAKLEEIEFFKNGMKLDISKDVIDAFELTGLNNADFISSGFYRKKH